jgi:hypothetical protein
MRTSTCILVSALWLGMAGNASAADTPLAEFANEDVLGMVVIPDLKTTLGRIDAAVVTVAGEGNPSVAELIGGNLGDPALDQMRTGAPLVVMAMKPARAGGPPSWIQFVPVNEGSTYAQTIAAIGAQAEEVDKVLIVAQSPEGLALGRNAMADYKALAGAAVDGDMRVRISFPRVIANWGPTMRMGMDGFANLAALSAQGGMDAKTMVAMLAGEMHILMLLIEQSDQLQLDMAISGERLICRQIVKARDGTSLSQVFSAPTEAAAPAGLLSNSVGAMAMSARTNASGIRALIADILKELSNTPATQQLLTEAIAQQVTDVSSAFDGSCAMSMQFKDDGVAIEGASGLSDPSKGQKLVELMETMYAADSPIQQMYQSMGVTFALERSVREHAGVSVNRINATKDPSKAPPQQAAALQLIPTNQEVAIAKNWCVFASQPEALNTLIDRATGAATAAPSTTRAEKAHGSGRDFYLDYDILRILQISLKQVFGDMPAPANSDPMTISGSFDKGSLRSECRIPLKPFGEFKRAVEENMGGQGGRALPENGIDEGSL